MLGVYCHYGVFHRYVILQTSSENPWARGNYLDSCFTAEETEEEKQRVSHWDTERACLRGSVFKVSEFKRLLRTLQQGNKTASKSSMKCWILLFSLYNALERICVSGDGSNRKKCDQMAAISNIFLFHIIGYDLRNIVILSCHKHQLNPWCQIHLNPSILLCVW